MAENQEEAPWWEKFSALGARTAPSYSKETLLRQFNILGDILNAGTLLIDVRRNDHEGGVIRGSLNMPAQSFPYHMATLYRLCHGDGVNVISRVMFYCGSSNGRGPRCAAWFKDYCAQRAEAEGIPENMADPQVFTLEGGIKGWVAGGAPYRAQVDGYDEAYWMQFAEVKTVGKRTVESSTGDDAMEEDGEENQTKRRVLGMKGPGGSSV
ncbi:hypothetical protein FKW77_010653 [Venturia effusa]|uniref:Rhodanese domain-containing protein n=1 Tax=Venturia effusa TaxID=50376 RepID=A0A517KY24_9PEZI|nr:hypothetical protein FKW77_010653 [Venturia effusa]